MVTDIFFILMATFGFYFGFTFGMMRVLLLVLSLIFASLTAMKFTSTTAELISQTFGVESPFLPFVAFLITLVIILMMARMVAKFIEETITNKRFDIISQVAGGLLMSLLFTLLYSVLVTFFGQAHVINLVFNQDLLVTKADKSTYLIAVDENKQTKDLSGKPYKIIILSTRDSIFETQTGGKIGFGLKKKGKGYQALIKGKKTAHPIYKNDTFYLGSKQQVQIFVDDKMKCFCDNKLEVLASNDSISFHCTDKYLSSKHKTSFFYKYIEIIPKRGAMVIEQMAFVKTFVTDMKTALKRVEQGKKKLNKPINVFSTEDEHPTAGQLQEKDKFELEKDTFETIPDADSIVITIDTSNMPVVKPKQEETAPPEEEDEKVEYEG